MSKATNKSKGNPFRVIGSTFVEGDIFTKLSYIIMGLGPIVRKSFVRGFGFLLAEVAFIYYMIAFGWQYISKIGTLGTTQTYMDPNTFITTYGDNSFLILLFSVLTIILLVFLVLLWYLNICENRKEEEYIKEGRHIPTAKEDLASLLDGNFHITLLTLPMIGIFTFTVLPILFMICIAFTNYDADHQAPSKLFTWVGFQNFINLFSFGGNGFGSTFFKLLAMVPVPSSCLST